MRSIGYSAEFLFEFAEHCKRCTQDIWQKEVYLQHSKIKNKNPTKTQDLALIKKKIYIYIYLSFITGLLLLARSPISSSLFQSLHPESNLPLALIKVKIPQLLYKTATGWAHSNPAAGDNLSSPSLLLPLCVFPAFIRLSHPAQLPSCYLLTRPSLHPLLAVFSSLALFHILLCVRACVCVCLPLPTLQKYSVRREKSQLSQLPNAVSLTSLFFLL